MTGNSTNLDLSRRHDIKTEFNEEVIKLTEVDVIGNITESIIKLKDQAIREALEKLGWLPPETAQSVVKERDELKAHCEMFDKNIKTAIRVKEMEDIDIGLLVRSYQQAPTQSLIDHDKTIAKQAFIQGFLASGEGYNGEIECGEAPESLIEQAEEYAESLGSEKDGE